MKNFKVGLQLFSVRDEMAKDMRATLKTVKEMGYDYVEFAGYFGKSAEEIRSILDEVGLECVSAHQTYDVFLSNPEENLQYLKTIGAKYCAIPWMGIEKHKGNSEFEKTVGEIKTVAKLLKENGIQMLYHNHDFEFVKYDDKYLFDWLYETVGLDLLKPEIDTCWVKYAGENPCAYLEKYGGNIDVVHFKDFVCDELAEGPVYDLIDKDGKEQKAPKSKEENKFKFEPLGKGMMKFEAVLKSAETGGAQYIIVEQDNSYDTPSLENAKSSRNYLRTLGI